MTDSYNIILDEETVDRIDAWRSQSLVEPSRRPATRALVKSALKVLHKRQAKAATTIAPTMSATKIKLLP